MRPVVVLKHEFVEFIPEELDEKTIYVSIRFATATHLCCCGCGNKVVTPLRPTDWSLVFDGKTVSLHPSVGNWSFPCQSHYWIRNNRASWAAQWTKEEIAAGRARGARRKGSISPIAVANWTTWQPQSHESATSKTVWAGDGGPE